VLCSLLCLWIRYLAHEISAFRYLLLDICTRETQLFDFQCVFRRPGSGCKSRLFSNAENKELSLEQINSKAAAKARSGKNRATRRQDCIQVATSAICWYFAMFMNQCAFILPLCLGYLGFFIRYPFFVQTYSALF